MSVAHIHGGSAVASILRHNSSTGGQDAARAWTVGQQVNVTIQRQLGAQYYLAQIAGRQGQLVESSVALAAGVPMRATVVAVGDRLELKLIDSDSQSTVLVNGSDPNADETSNPDSSGTTGGDAGGVESAAAMAAQIDVLSGRFQLTLGEREHSLLAAAMVTVKDPQAMALGGLYLAKIGMPLTNDALGALYNVQSESHAGPRGRDSAVDLGALAAAASAPTQTQLHPLAERMDLALNGPRSAAAAPAAAGEVASPSQAGPSTSDEFRDGGGPDDLALKLLNAPLAATASRQYGTFPILVAGQLLELQFVAFQHRETPMEQNPVKRLVMTLTTATLGRIQIAAQAQGSRLSVSFTGQSARATESLAGHAAEVRELVGRLGWRVDSVVYGVGRSGSAAELAMRHALRENTMDQLL